MQDEHCYELGKSPFANEDPLCLLTLIAKNVAQRWELVSCAFKHFTVLR